jgi:hypothetical protein
MICRNRDYFLVLMTCSQSQGVEEKGRNIFYANSEPGILLALLALPHLNFIRIKVGFSHYAQST